jgi:hypothetical protein
LFLKFDLFLKFVFVFLNRDQFVVCEHEVPHWAPWTWIDDNSFSLNWHWKAQFSGFQSILRIPQKKVAWLDLSKVATASDLWAGPFLRRQVPPFIEVQVKWEHSGFRAERPINQF